MVNLEDRKPFKATEFEMELLKNCAVGNNIVCQGENICRVFMKRANGSLTLYEGSLNLSESKIFGAVFQKKGGKEN